MFSTKALDEVHSQIDDFAGHDECCSWAAYDTLKALNNFILATYQESLRAQKPPCTCNNGAIGDALKNEGV